MNTEVKRPNYFRGQFLIENDFFAEQTYHRDLRQQHLLALHGWGVIGDGMQVEQSDEDAQNLIVSPGVAVDKNGREIVLATSRTVTLDSAAPNAEVFLSIRYEETRVESDRYTGPTSSDAIQEYTRITEQPQFDRTSDHPSDDGLNILLAKITLDENANIAEIDTSIRQYVSCWIAPEAINTEQLADRAVTTNKISDGAIITDKISNDTITANKLNKVIRDNLTTLTGGAESNASELHFHRSIPVQKKRYAVPLIPLKLTLKSNTDEFRFNSFGGASSYSLKVDQGTRPQTLLPISLPDGAKFTKLSAVVSYSVSSENKTLFRIQLTRKNIIGRSGVIFSTLNIKQKERGGTLDEQSTELSPNLQHVVDNSTTYYFVDISTLDTEVNTKEIHGILIDYELDRLF